MACRAAGCLCSEFLCLHSVSPLPREAPVELLIVVLQNDAAASDEKMMISPGPWPE